MSDKEILITIKYGGGSNVCHYYVDHTFREEYPSDDREDPVSGVWKVAEDMEIYYKGYERDDDWQHDCLTNEIMEALMLRVVEQELLGDNDAR